MSNPPWAVVLAGGEGERVSALTRDASGQIVPKQYWSCFGRESMLRWAVARAYRIASAARVLIVVNEHHRRFWQRELADVPSANLLVQPCNRGTAVGVLFALLHIHERGGADAPVVLLPSDHYVADEPVLHEALRAAVDAACQRAPSVILLGMTPADIDSSYGWILPAKREPIAPVLHFVEKPPVETIGRLMSCGALVNSFIMVARTMALLDLVERARPEIVEAFRLERSRTPAGGRISNVYESLSAVDMSRDVLERTAHALSVAEVPPCGWSDLGTPGRLRNFLDHGLTAPPASDRPMASHAAA